MTDDEAISITRLMVSNHILEDAFKAGCDAALKASQAREQKLVKALKLVLELGVPEFIVSSKAHHTLADLGILE